MPIGIGGVAFEGPYTRHEILCRRPGVFAVLDGRDLPPLHAEKADDVRQAVEDHARWNRWQETCETPSFAVFYTSVDRNQRRVEQAVRDEYGLHEYVEEYEEPETAAVTNGRPAEAAPTRDTRGTPAPAPDTPRTEERPAAAAAHGEAREAGRDAREAGEAENRRPAAAEKEGRSFHFHVPADPVDHRRARVS